MSDETVTVCAGCLCACCWLGRFMCDSARNAGTVEKTRDELRALGREHPGYWRVKKGDDLDCPRTAEDIRDLAEYTKRKANADAGIFVSYLTQGECGLDPAMVKAALADVWPEAAEAVWVPPADGGV